jgi:crossover junction endodeoxyribonuclease RuvC
MRVLGIDPGLRFTGYGCVDLPVGAVDPVLVEGGVFRLKPTASLEDRLAQLYEDLSEVITELRPDRLVVEKIFSHYKHVTTAIRMGHARGVVLLAARHRDVHIGELAPTEIKKATTGNGHATKHQMQQAIMNQFGLSELPNPPDVADAIAIAACGARRALCAAVAVG